MFFLCFCVYQLDDCSVVDCGCTRHVTAHVGSWPLFMAIALELLSQLDENDLVRFFVGSGYIFNFDEIDICNSAK